MTRILYLSVLMSILFVRSTFAQCNVDTNSTFYKFLNPGLATPFEGFLCTDIDSVGTFGSFGFYDGNGFSVKLITGTQVTFSIDSCSGNSMSMTMVDSANVIIPGAYSGPSCPNTLDFTATYTGTFSVVLNLNGICSGTGTTVLGQVNVKIKAGTTAPACSGVINDTICGAIELQVDSGFSAGNSNDAYPTDPMDTYLGTIGANVCSTPNNTMWYYFQPDANIDTLNVWMTSGAGSGFHSWVVVLEANDTNDFCNGGLTFIDCEQGAADDLGIDTTSFQIYNLVAGHNYILMVDGYSGMAGPFSIGLKSQPYLTAMDELYTANIFVYPNPATDFLIINSKEMAIRSVSIEDLSGRQLLKEHFGLTHSRTLDIGQYTSGIYILRIEGQSGFFQKKISISGKR